MSKKHPRKVGLYQKSLPYLIVLVVSTVISGGLMFTLTQTRSQDVTLATPDQQVTLGWIVPDAGEHFRTGVFSADGETIYTLTNQRVLAIRNWTIRSIYQFDASINPSTMAIHPDGNELAIGAMQQNQLNHQQAIIITLDLNTEAVKSEWTSGASYNLGGSKAIAYTPSGDALYHLFNLNNAGCGRTFDVLERWHADGTHEPITLPSSHAFDLVITDDALAVTLSDSCIPMMNNTYMVVSRQDVPDALVFETPESTGYQHLQASANQRMMIGSMDRVQPPFTSTIHVWDDFDLTDDITVDQRITSMAISPDSHLIALAIARDSVPVAIGNDGADIEIHLYDRIAGQIIFAMQINTATPITQIAFNTDGTTLLLRNADQLAIVPLTESI